MILCQELIWTSTDKANTYCMRERGHKGKHNITNCEPEEETKCQTELQTPTNTLSKHVTTL